MIFEATEVTSAEHTQSTRKVGAPSVSYDKDKQGSSLVLNHYCLLYCEPVILAVYCNI